MSLYSNLNEEMRNLPDIEQGDTAYIKFKLDIKDFGAGIPADKIHKLFMNFGNLAEHQQIN